MTNPSTGNPSLSHDALDPVKIRADIAPVSELGEQRRQRQLRGLQAGLVAAVLLGLASLLAPVFVPLDTRPRDLSLIHADSVIIFTDPPGATAYTLSKNIDGHTLGSTGQAMTVAEVTGGKDSVQLSLRKPGYVTLQQSLTPMDLGARIWPQLHQPILRLTPKNPWIYLTDYLPRHRPWLFASLCLSAIATILLGLALRVHYRGLAARERARRNEKSRDNLTGLSVLGYEVVERLGSGATSLVYRGFSEKDFSTERALRFSRLAQVTPQEVDTFRREIGVYQKIDHPNIVKAYGFQRFENTFVIVMELIEGESLDSLFGEGRPLATETALPIFSAIAAGLDHAHSKGVVHRDLKPANVMMRRDGTPAVVDFGMATDLDVTKITQTGVVKGTLAYIAPEQIADPTKVGPAADQFAFGLMLYEALCGKFAYSIDDVSRLLSERMSGAAIPFSQAAPSFPAEVAAAVMTMIATDPQKRFPSITEGMAAVRAALGKECKTY